MLNINGYEIKSAFSGGEPLKAIYSLGEKVWPTTVPEPEPVNWGGLKFTALEPGEIGMTHYIVTSPNTYPSLSYSRDGVNWVKWDYKPISVDTGCVVCFKGINDTINDDGHLNTFYFTAKIRADGNIMSLLYGDKYAGEVSLRGKPECFRVLFADCTSLISAPSLPATELGEMCYRGMFEGCTSLKSAPGLPATTLKERCYLSMFSGCSSLTSAPKLPSKSLEYACYAFMFEGCTSLVDAPALPAKSLLKVGCYNGMFYGCTSLVDAPALPSKSLADACYAEMFRDCKSLVKAPELPAIDLYKHCYDNMFYGCLKLNYVKANFTTTPHLEHDNKGYTENWLYGVSKTGTFVANPSATWPSTIERGSWTVPSGWEIQQ